MPINLSRRRFFGFLAAPAIVRAASLMPISALPEESYLDALAESFRATEEIVHANVLNAAAIRDLLLPGLVGVSGQYPSIPRQWQRLYGKAI